MADDQRHPAAEPVTPPSPDEPKFENRLHGERRETVGRLLRRTRETRGADLHTIAEELRIRRAYLEAIEQGAFDRLPGATYAVGFVRSYAAHLGLDDDEVVRRFKEEVAGLDGGQELRFPEPVNEGKVPGGAVILVSLALLVIAYGVWYVLSSPETSLGDMAPAVPGELQALINGDEGAERQSQAGEQDVAASEGGAGQDGAVAADAPAGGQAGAGAIDGDAPAGTQAASASGETGERAATADRRTPQAAGSGTGSGGAVPVPDKPAVSLVASVSAAGRDASAENGADRSGSGDVAETANAGTSGTAQASAPAVPDDGTEAAAVEDTGEVETAAAGNTGGGDAAAGGDAASGSATGAGADASTGDAEPEPDAAQTARTGNGDAFGAAAGESVAVLRATADSWIQVRAPGGEVLISRVLQAGSRYRVPDRDGLKLDTGNAGGLTVVIDGEAVRTLGDAGEVRRNIPLSRAGLRSGG